MRLQCYFCYKSVSNEVPEETVVRALLICPECIEAGKIQIPDTDSSANARESS